MILIQNNTAIRESFPDFLRGLSVESLRDLSWTDPQLGVQDQVWWPEQEVEQTLEPHQKFGEEVLTLDTENQVVLVSREVLDKTPEELEAELAAWREQAAVTPLEGLLAIDQLGMAAAFNEWASSPDRTFAQRAFLDKAQTWRRNDPTLVAGAADLGLTPEQLDQIFRTIIENR